MACHWNHFSVANSSWIVLPVNALFTLWTSPSVERFAQEFMRFHRRLSSSHERRRWNFWNSVTLQLLTKMKINDLWSSWWFGLSIKNDFALKCNIWGFVYWMTSSSLSPFSLKLKTFSLKHSNAQWSQRQSWLTLLSQQFGNQQKCGR